MFIDCVKIKVESGKGGNGCISFRREKYIARGGPDGGDGGKGGNIIIAVEKDMRSLTHLRDITYVKATSGGHGRGKNCRGKDGDNKVIKVPPGTVVYKFTAGKKSILADLLHSGETLVVAKGGTRGKGNTSFKSSINRAPRQCSYGTSGEKATLLFELKLIADVGFVGYPNAGKSTLLSRISNAKPKIANYAFTTLTPVLGNVTINYRKIIFADIPGIIDGAAKGKGLGLEFLKHIERTVVLAFILDITDNPEMQYENLKKELFQYNPLILKKRFVIVLNKIDLVAASQLKSLNLQFPGATMISAINGDGTDKFLKAINEQLV